MDPEQFARLIEILGLTAAQAATAEGEEPAAPEPVTVDQVFAKVGELVATEAGTNLTALQQQFDQVKGELDAKVVELEGIATAKREAEADATLEQFASRLGTPESRAKFRELLLADQEGTLVILNGLPTPTAAPAAEEPPKPVHPAPGEDAPGGMTDQEKIAEQNKLIAAIRKEVRGTRTPFADFDSARAEARRRKPELFA